MSITDELRDCIRTANRSYEDVRDPYNDREILNIPEEELLKIADRIDAEHEKAAAGCIHYDPERHYCSVHGDTESGWGRLPLDADGVPFRIGDKVDSDHYEDGTVTGIQFYKIYNGGIRTLIAVSPDGWDVATWHTPDEYRHHHAPTVEDVLREFAERYLDYEGMPSAGRRGVGEALMDEYAAKLRLAGSDAE